MKNSGFTLVELIVSSVIGACILAVAVTAQRAIAGSRIRIDDYVEIESELRYVETLLRRDLANLYRNGAAKSRKFIGTINEEDRSGSAQLRFWTVSNVPVRPGRPEGDVYEVEYLIKERDDRMVMMRRVQPNPLNQENPGGVVTTISENIIGFNVRYMADGAEEWAEEWTEKQNSLPAMVEILLTSGKSGSKKASFRSILIDFHRYPKKAEKSKSDSDSKSPSNPARGSG